jgi:hypothetical protein
MIEGMSHKEYHQFLREVEESMYDPRDFKILPDDDVWADPESGTKTVYYVGRRNKSYSQPVFEIKRDHAERGGFCSRCKPDSTWQATDDQVIPANWLTVFDRDGNRRGKPTPFLPYFAARRAHP